MYGVGGWTIMCVPVRGGWALVVYVSWVSGYINMYTMLEVLVTICLTIVNSRHTGIRPVGLKHTYDYLRAASLPGPT